MGEESKERERLLFANVGQNDKYLINKLGGYNISLDKIDSYLSKLKADNSLD